MYCFITENQKNILLIGRRMGYLKNQNWPFIKACREMFISGTQTVAFYVKSFQASVFPLIIFNGVRVLKTLCLQDTLEDLCD